MKVVCTSSMNALFRKSPPNRCATIVSILPAWLPPIVACHNSLRSIADPQDAALSRLVTNFLAEQRGGLVARRACSDCNVAWQCDCPPLAFQLPFLFSPIRTSCQWSKPDCLRLDDALSFENLHPAKTSQPSLISNQSYYIFTRCLRSSDHHF